MEGGKTPGTGSTRSHPIALYLKAHLLNRKVIRARQLSKGFALTFEGPFGDEPGVGEWEVEVSGPRELVHRFKIPGRKIFEKTIQLAKLPPLAEAAGANMTPTSESEEGVSEMKPDHSRETDPPRRSSKGEAGPTPEQRKHARLLKNIEADRLEAETALAWLRPLCAQIGANPLLWGTELPPEFTEAVHREIAREKLPAFAAATRKMAVETLFQMKRRSERKLQAAAERLAKMQRRGPAPAAISGTKPLDETRKEIAAAKEFPKRKPGLWVQLSETLWARVGRSASENGELFRQARDRDLWFHVRGAAGAHVWVPRGQKGFGARNEASQDLLRWGCQLALLNSDAARAGWAVVDYTERRYLKKLRGDEGAVEILRSETRRTNVDKALEKKWFK